MRLYRVFDWDGESLADKPGGPLHVARRRQGAGRHDAPARYGAWYCSRTEIGAVAECIQAFRGVTLTNADLQRTDGRRKALATFELDDRLRVIDLDDAAALVQRQVRPSHVASPRRAITQKIAEAVFEERAAGLGWWSVLNADWAHVTLFHERVRSRVTLIGPPEVLWSGMPALRAAAAYLGVRL